MGEKKRIVLVLCACTGQTVDRGLISDMEKWCDAEGYQVVALTLVENTNAVVGRKTYDMVKTLIDKDMIDGLVTYSVYMFNSAEGEATVNYIYDKNKFFVPCVEEIKQRHLNDSVCDTFCNNEDSICIRFCKMEKL